MKIRILNQDTINKIAAGEVIIRPSSVVKELVENSIDAGSTRIKVSIIEGGKQEIKITDNGCGILFDEIPLAFKRHATSKINFLEDLEDLSTMGFRGEALSSIASVSNVTITTRSNEEELGSKSVFEDGNLINRRVCPFEEGTEIVVSDLFRTIPARLKFLKKSESEEKHIRDILQKLALSHPEISFEYINNHKRVFITSGNGNLKDVARSLFGNNFASHLYSFKAQNLPMKIHGLIGDLDARRSYRDNQIFFINNRYVKSKELSRAYEEEWEGKLMKHQYPSGIIFIDLPPKMLDINVHPQKTEIRILNKSLVTILFKQCLREALKSLQIIPETIETVEENEINVVDINGDLKPDNTAGSKSLNDFGQQESFRENFFESPINNQFNTSEKKEDYYTNESIENIEENLFNKTFNDFYYDNKSSVSFDNNEYSKNDVLNNFDFSIESESENKLPDTNHNFNQDGRLDLLSKNFIGQVFNTYLILEDLDELLIIDQHAAHEAILYETFSEAFKKQTQFESQLLFIPEYIDLTIDEIEDFKKIKDRIKAFGFSAEIENDRLKVSSVPLILDVVQPADLILPLMSWFLGKNESPEIGLQKIITASCKAAVKGGDKLSPEEINELLLKLSHLDNPYTCPHGRPIIRKQSKNELEKLFKRIV